MNNELLPVITIGLNLNNERFEYSMKELSALAFANNMQVVEELVQKLDHPDSATYFGKGKVELLKETATAHNVNTVVVNDELSPSQLRNLEKKD